jgi:hypothetical protein
LAYAGQTTTPFPLILSKPCLRVYAHLAFSYGGAQTFVTRDNFLRMEKEEKNKLAM